jgi:hypothetical protein
MKKIVGILSIVAAAALFFTACNKEKIETVVDNLTMSQDLNTAQQIIEDEEDEIIGDEIGFRGGCVVKSFSVAQGTYPQDVTLDFGAGCEGKNGKIRKGKLIVNLSADPKTAGAVITVNPLEFFVEDIKVEGTRIWTNIGRDASGNRQWKREVQNGKLTFPNGKLTTFTATETVKQTAGASTLSNRFDDAYEITGTRTGINRAGKEFVASITKALVKKGDCANIVSGIIEISREGNARTLDFGNGNCDQIGIVTLADGSIREIQLRRWW